jgi:hypothetical protein
MAPMTLTVTRGQSHLFGGHYRDGGFGRDGDVIDLLLVILQTPPEGLEKELD